MYNTQQKQQSLHDPKLTFNTLWVDPPGAKKAANFCLMRLPDQSKVVRNLDLEAPGDMLRSIKDCKVKEGGGSGDKACQEMTGVSTSSDIASPACLCRQCDFKCGQITGQPN